MTFRNSKDISGKESQKLILPLSLLSFSSMSLQLKELRIYSVLVNLNGYKDEKFHLIGIEMF